MARKKTKSIKKNNKTILYAVVVIVLIIFGYLGRDNIKDLYNEIISDVDLKVEGEFTVHFIDVGQGDSILIQNSNDEFMLIDTGESSEYNKLTSYLENFNVTDFKYVIFTHPHSDHMGSADKIVKNYNIENLIMSSGTNNTKTFERLVDEIEKKKLEIIPAVPGEVFKFGEAEFLILAPELDEYKNLNNYSVVIKMTYGKTDFLFTGDMEKELENEVMKFCEKNNINLSSDVLKVAHHGSSTSSQAEFLRLISPKVAIIMCGKDNSYNHPNLQTVGRIESVGATILRTDLLGDIVMISDGNDLSVKKGRGEAEKIN